MVKKSNEAENEPIALKWTWMPEVVDQTVLLGKGQVSANQLLDQKIANDVSDYMWYMTRYFFNYLQKNNLYFSLLLFN